MRNLRCYLACTVIVLSLTAILAGISYGYSLTGAKWHISDMPVHFVINDAGSIDADVFGSVQNSFSTWSGVPFSYLEYNYGGMTSYSSAPTYDDINLIIWIRDGWDFGDGVIALCNYFYQPSTGQIVDSDIIFNGVDYRWSNSGRVGRMDVQNTATHEIGHFSGLDDLYSAADSEKTMYGYAQSGETLKRTLHPDDEAGIVALYPSTPDAATYYRDVDGDGFGDPNDSSAGTTQPAGYVPDATDCDDADVSVYPGATDICDDTIDQDCNGFDAACNDILSPDTIITGGPSGATSSSTASFTFTGFDDTALTANLQYSYYLQGYDLEYSSYGSLTAVTYSNLTDASYSFFVRSRDDAGNIDESPATREFMVDMNASAASGDGDSGSDDKKCFIATASFTEQYIEHSNNINSIINNCINAIKAQF